ncbi:M20/M25/M40 family metallo-hydrolase [Acerihabitans sp.]|uniref:M20/M25/M40 family metallo-hydrolase n=1 Tax=Acerihabitans sp. TaxID=2811394 RepID=UPI002ED7AD89
MERNVTAIMRLVEQNAERLLDEAVAIATIPAPSFNESKRAAHIARRFSEVGLTDVAIDNIGNVTGRRPGSGPRVMVVSHMDTVFPLDTPLQPRIEGDRIYCPGIRDNSTAVANLISLARLLRETELTLPCEVILASSVCEEGLGDLRGIRKLMDTWGDKVDAVVAYDGDLGTVVYGGAGSKRYKITYRAAGGHSFSAFGNPSAVHGLATACARFCQLPVPSDPKTTLNVGKFNGGVSVNVIAEEAVAVIDMRSVSQAELEKIAAAALAIFQDTAKEFGCRQEIEKVGDRPGGGIDAQHPLIRTACDVLAAMRITPDVTYSSTDANIPFSLGIPAIAIGSSLGKGVHSVGESLHIPSIVLGLQQLIQFLARLDSTVIPSRSRT